MLNRRIIQLKLKGTLSAVVTVLLFTFLSAPLFAAVKNVALASPIAKASASNAIMPLTGADPTKPVNWHASDLADDVATADAADGKKAVKPVLQALICNRNVCQAIVNGQLLSAGDKFAHYIVNKITKDSIEIRTDDADQKVTTLPMFVDIFSSGKKKSAAVSALSSSATTEATGVKPQIINGKEISKNDPAMGKSNASTIKN